MSDFYVFWIVQMLPNRAKHHISLFSLFLTKNHVQLQPLSESCSVCINLVYLFHLHGCFHKQRFFSTKPQCCFTFSWIELQMLLRCCLIHQSIIILRHLILTVFLSMSRSKLYMSYLCDVFFIFIIIFIMINRHTCSFAYFWEYVLVLLDDNVGEKCE